jgi:ParB family chromosome partitioning protein
MAIKTSDLNAKLFGKTNKRRATTTVEAQQAAKEQAQIIELSVAGQELVSFELTKISYKDIEKRTIVFADNAREQSFLNEHALSDILVTLKEKGQQYPAVGRLNDNGIIEVLDGSRRRMSCILSNQDFLIYVAKDINLKHAKFLSDVANAHKPLSLYERGKEMQLMLENGSVSDQKELAEVCQCSEALVSGALKAATLPLELLQAYPSVGELGRPTIVKLHKLYSSLSSKQQQDLLHKCVNDEGFVWQKSDVQGVARITKEVSTLIESWVEASMPTDKKTTPTHVELVKGRANYVRNNDKLNLKLKGVDDKLMDDILQFLQSRMH